MAEEYRFQAGNATIVATNHHFSDGYIYGFLSFYDTRTRPPFPLTSETVTRYILAIAYEAYCQEWIAGCIVGWVDALLENSDETFTSQLIATGVCNAS